MEKRALADSGVDWQIAKLFPVCIKLPKGEEGFRKKFGVWKEDGSTIAYYDHVEDDYRNSREIIVTYQYAIIDGELFLVEEYEPRYRSTD